MSPTIRNIIIVIAVGAIGGLVYFFFLKPTPGPESSLSTNGVASTLPAGSTAVDSSAITQEFLTLLLNVKNIKLNDGIFASDAFSSLHDSSIVLVPLPGELGGRHNPFAPIGVDDSTVSASSQTPSVPASVMPNLTPASTPAITSPSSAPVLKSTTTPKTPASIVPTATPTTLKPTTL